MPRYDRTDDRYELLNKFQSILRRFGFAGVIVLMDRVDEPHLTGGTVMQMNTVVDGGNIFAHYLPAIDSDATMHATNVTGSRFRATSLRS